MEKNKEKEGEEENQIRKKKGNNRGIASQFPRKVNRKQNYERKKG
jgi:hypothetical protein